MRFSSSFMIGFIAAIIGFTVCRILVRKTRAKDIFNNKYDERQKVQQGQSALHTLIFTAGLLLLSGILSELLDYQLTLLTQNILIIAISSGFFVVEQLVRGAYFGVNFTDKKLRFFWLFWLFYTAIAVVWTFRTISNGSRLIQSGALTSDGFAILVYWYIVLIYGLIVAGWFLGKRGNKK
ncbi:hypothetical protein [Lactovum odontotermitis]